MLHTTILHDANNISFQRFLETYLRGIPIDATGNLEGATILVEPSRHRTHVPRDAEARRYIITHPDMAWSIVARSVWRNGRLHMPRAVHTCIECYNDLDGRYGDQPEHAVNSWFRGLNL